MVYGSFESFGTLQKAMEEMKFEILSSGFERIPTTMKEISEEQMKDIDKLLGKLEEDDDVMNVFHNMTDNR